MLYPRVLVATAVLNASLLPVLAPYLLGPAVVAAAVAVIGIRQFRRNGVTVPQAANPLQLMAALQMGLTFQVVLALMSLLGRTWGDAGVFSSAAVLGLTDVDALTVAMAKGVAHTTSLETAGVAIAIGVLSNTALKLAVALFFGSVPFRKIAGGTLFLMLGAAAAALVWIR